MKTSLIIFGVIFLVVGGLLYFMPMQEVKANTTTVGSGNVDTRTSSARVTVPVEWAFASAIIGLILLVLGFAIPSMTIKVVKNDPKNSRKNSYEKTVESKEDIKNDDGGKRKIVREHIEKHNTLKDEDDD